MLASVLSWPLEVWLLKKHIEIWNSEFLKAEALKNYLFYNLKIQSDICGCGKFIVEYFKSVI